MKTIEKVDDPLTVNEVAADLEMHPHTVRRLIRTNKLRAYKRSGGRIDKKSWLIDPVDLKKFKVGDRIYNTDSDYAERVADGYATVSNGSYSR